MQISDHYLDLIQLAQTPNMEWINKIRTLLKPRPLLNQLSGKNQHGWKKIWLRYIKITSAIVAPLKVNSAPTLLNRIPGVFLVLWIDLVALLASLLTSVKASGFDLPDTPSTIPATEAAIFEVFFWGFVIFIAPAQYHHLIRYLTEKKHNFFYRAIFLGALITTLLIVLALPGVVIPRTNLYLTTHELRWLDFVSLLWVVLIMFIPSLAYLWFLAVDLILWLVLILAGTWVYFILFHESHPIKQIQRLVFEGIPSRKDENVKWHLMDLSEVELEAIQDWADANREGTEKRLLPTIIFFSLIQLFGWNAIVNTEIGQKMVEIWNQVAAMIASDPATFLGAVMSTLVGLAIALFLFPFVAIGKLFLNILPQSLIIEACIVAKHQKYEQNQSTPTAENQPPALPHFWDRFAYALGYVRADHGGK